MSNALFVLSAAFVNVLVADNKQTALRTKVHNQSLAHNGKMPLSTQPVITIFCNGIFSLILYIATSSNICQVFDSVVITVLCTDSLTPIC